MTAITVTRRIDSAHLDLPELLPFIGKDVEIRIVEAPVAVAERPDRWKALEAIMGRTDLIDMGLIRSAEEADWADAARGNAIRKEYIDEEGARGSR